MSSQSSIKRSVERELWRLPLTIFCADQIYDSSGADIRMRFSFACLAATGCYAPVQAGMGVEGRKHLHKTYLAMLNRPATVGEYCFED